MTAWKESGWSERPKTQRIGEGRNLKVIFDRGTNRRAKSHARSLSPNVLKIGRCTECPEVGPRSNERTSNTELRGPCLWNGVFAVACSGPNMIYFDVFRVGAVARQESGQRNGCQCATHFGIQFRRCPLSLCVNTSTNIPTTDLKIVQCQPTQSQTNSHPPH